MDNGACLTTAVHMMNGKFMQSYIIYQTLLPTVEICSHSRTFAQYVQLLDHFTALTFQGYVKIMGYMDDLHAIKSPYMVSYWR